MNSKELKLEMLRNEDSGVTLAEALGITNATFSNKLNAKNAEFTQKEIMFIKNRYHLSAERVDAIFFADDMS